MAGRVLILEDDENILEMLTDMLHSAGFGVIGLRYPDLVMDVVGRERPDLLLIDIMLPRRSGVEVADLLWTNGFGTIPMIALSASGIMMDLARQTPFFQDVMRKPFEMDDLLSTVDRVLSAHDPAVVPSPVRPLT